MQDLVYYQQLLPSDLLTYLNKFVDCNDIDFYTRWPINFIKIFNVNEFWKDRVLLDLSANVNLPLEEYRNFWYDNMKKENPKSIPNQDVANIIYNGFENKLSRIYKKKIDYLKSSDNSKQDVTYQTVFILQHAVHYGKENILNMILDFAFANQELYSWWITINDKLYINEPMIYSLFEHACELNNPKIVEVLCQHNMHPDYISETLVSNLKNTNLGNVNLVLLKYVIRDVIVCANIISNMRLITDPNFKKACLKYLQECGGNVLKQFLE